MVNFPVGGRFAVINDLPNISKKLTFFLFADDTNIYYESKNLKEIEKTVNEELKKLSLWLNINRLALNVAKTNFVIFRSCQKFLDHNVTLVMNRKALQQKDHVKYLGVLLDQHLKWKYQINNVALKISRGIGILAKLKPYLKMNLLKNVYYSLVYSHLSYGVLAWGSADKTLRNKLVVLQNKAIRILSKVQYFQIYGQDPGPLPSSEPLYSKLEILKFDDIFRLNVANFVYSTLDFQTPQIFHDWFVFDYEIHDHSTRLSSVIICENYFDVGSVHRSLMLHTSTNCNNNYGKKTMKTTGPSIWNCVPDYIQEVTSIQSFKSKFKAYLINQYDKNGSQNSHVNNNNGNSNHNRRIDNNYNSHINRPTGSQFQSRWNDGPNNLI